MKLISSVKNFSGKTALLRSDLDAPRSGAKILDETRIRAAVPTIQYLYDNGAKVVIVSKSGKPDGVDPGETLAPNGELLAQLLGKKFVCAESEIAAGADFVFFKGELTDSKNIAALKKSPRGNIILLENIRFYRQEKDADPKFAKILAELGDFFVNDAFAMMHRNEASVAVVPHFLPAYAGLNVEKEIRALDKLLTLKASPFVVVMGGAKISDKVGTIKNLGKTADQILIGGGPANLFFLAKGFEIGKSLCERDQLKTAQDFLRNFKEKIILPLDVVAADPNDFSKRRVCKPDAVKENEAIYDIGPQTILEFSKYIKAAKKMVWNGPMGLFEQKPFSHGTMSVALIYSAMCQGHAYGIVGGGDTLSAVNQAKVADKIDFVSTAGSAALDYLAGEELPGLKALGN